MNIEEYARMFEAEEHMWWYAGMRRITMALLESSGVLARRPEGPILDAGCGTGNNLVHLRTLGATVGLDFSAEALEFCRTRGVDVVRGSVMALPFTDASASGVTALDVLYHAWVTDDRAAVAEMARVVRPGGFVLVRVHALKVLRGAHDEAILSRHRYTRREVENLLRSSGLQVVRTTYANCFLFPLLLVWRTLDRITGRQGSDVGFLPAPLEWLFLRVLRLEAWLVRRGLTLPIGASVIALARKS